MGTSYLAFRHTTSPDNIIGAHSVIEPPSGVGGEAIFHGNSNAIVFVCHRINPVIRQGTLSPHSVGVTYIRGLGRWAIVNLDGAPMRPRLAFDVLGYVGPSGNAFIHRVTEANCNKATTWIDSMNPLVSDPTSVFFVTPRLSATGSLGAADSRALNHPIGVWFNERTRRWNIFNQDGAHMVPGAGYNVEEHFRGDGAGNHARVVVSSGEHGELMPFDIWPDDSDITLIWVTQNMSFRFAADSVITGDRNVRAVVNPRPVGSFYRTKWRELPVRVGGDVVNDLAVCNEDFSPIVSGVCYNVHHR